MVLYVGTSGTNLNMASHLVYNDDRIKDNNQIVAVVMLDDSEIDGIAVGLGR